MVFAIETLKNLAFNFHTRELLTQCLLGCIIELVENNLYSLCKKFNTDKLEHDYVELYESYFKLLREEKLNLY